MRTLAALLFLVGCAPRSSDPATPRARAQDPAPPPSIRWRFTGQLHEAVSFAMEVAPEAGTLAVELAATLDVTPSGEPGVFNVDYRITDVQKLELTGVLAEGPALDDRRASLLELGHRFVVDEQGAFQSGSEPLTDAEHEALGPGLHAVDQFLTLPYVPEHAPGKYTLEVEGHVARFSGRDVEDAVESYDGVSAQLHSETRWTVVADLAAGRPLEREVESTAVARYGDGGEETHRGRATLRFTVEK